MCFNKPRVKLRKESNKTKTKRQQTRHTWFDENPPNAKGVWICYLNIASNCHVQLTASTIRLEHDKSKARHPELKYDIKNIKPACDPCNKLKGSMSAEEAIEKYVKIK